MGASHAKYDRMEHINAWYGERYVLTIEHKPSGLVMRTGNYSVGIVGNKKDQENLTAQNLTNGTFAEMAHKAWVSMSVGRNLWRRSSLSLAPSRKPMLASVQYQSRTVDSDRSS